MDPVLLISLAILLGLYWLHRREIARAYAAGQQAAQAEQDQRERHGLAPLPKDTPTT